MHTVLLQQVIGMDAVATKGKKKKAIHPSQLVHPLSYSKLNRTKKQPASIHPE